jgi:predicted P-loop ATPase
MQTLVDDDDNEFGLDKFLPPKQPSPSLTPEIADSTAVEPAAHTDKSKEDGDSKQKKLPVKINKYGAIFRLPSKLTLSDCIGRDNALVWPDLRLGFAGGLNPTATVANTRVALLAMKLDLGYDLFHDRMLINGHPITESAAELSDRMCHRLCTLIFQSYHFDPSPGQVHDAAVQLCLQNAFDPIVDYLDGLIWDGQSRLQTWMSTYLSAPDTELNQAIGAISLVAAVRRVREPGTKFDQIIVLEGVEGTSKSTAIEVLAGKDNFSDQTILGLDDRAQMERTKGVWLYEIADLSGITKADVDAVKAFASRTHDRARAAYGRATTNQPRRCVFFATTNNETYLKSQTGNRRFWPVQTGRIDLDALRRDRDQLWAEAAALEAGGMSIFLPEDMWADARAEQAKRLEHDPWDDILEGVSGEPYPTPEGGREERLSTYSLLFDVLKIQPDRVNSGTEKKLKQAMNRLGWGGPAKMRINGKPQRAYRRPIARSM